MPPLPTHTVRFGPFQLDLRAAEMHHNGTRIKLPEQPFQILAELVEHPGEVVTREELRQRLWGSDTFVDFDQGLNAGVKRLRDLLGDSAEKPHYIETVPHRGYRLMVEVEPSEPPPPPIPVSLQRWKISLAALALLLVAAAAVWRQQLLDLFRPVKIESLAVLPLENLSSNPEEDYFADGMTEQLISELGKVRALRVISRQSVMQYKGTNKPVPQIARELHVDALIEGSVLLAGGKVRITTQLVQASRERHLWSDSYESNLSDIITLQREVTQAIVREIRVALTPQEQQSLANMRPVSPEAYEAYLKGRYHFDKWSTEDSQKARDWFRRAIDKDPHFAPAYAGLAWTYTLAPGRWRGSVRESYETARRLTQEALVIDGTLAEAHMVLADIMREYDWDWAGAEKEYRRAISLKPNDAHAHAQYSALLSCLARHEEAIKEAKLALQLDPVSPLTNGQVGYVLYWARRYDKAIEQLQKALDLDPNYSRAYYGLGRAYLEKGMPRKALEALNKGEGLVSVRRGPSDFLGYAYGALGERSEALKIADQLKIQRDQGDPDATWGLVRVYAGLGDKDQALAFMRKAYEEHYPSMEVIKVDPLFDRLHSDPRFQDLVLRMNFPE